MNTALGGKIVVRWACNAYGMPMFGVHQNEYPEIEAEGRTPAEACVRLIELLVQAIDFASEAWQRQPLRLALVDTRAFDRSFSASAWTEPRLFRQPSMKPDPRQRPPAQRRGHQGGDHHGTLSRQVAERRSGPG